MAMPLNSTMSEKAMGVAVMGRFQGEKVASMLTVMGSRPPKVSMMHC